MKKDKIEITGLELEILRIVNKYGYGKLNATKNSKGEFEYDGVIEMDLKKHDSMVKELTTLIEQEKVPFDENPIYGGVKNFASNVVTDEKSAFDYGFRLGWQTCWFEHNPQKIGTDQPQVTSIWGKRHYDKLWKELWWFIQEYLCEILVTIASLVCIYFIGNNWIIWLLKK